MNVFNSYKEGFSPNSPYHFSDFTSKIVNYIHKGLVSCKSADLCPNLTSTFPIFNTKSLDVPSLNASTHTNIRKIKDYIHFGHFTKCSEIDTESSVRPCTKQIANTHQADGELDGAKEGTLGRSKLYPLLHFCCTRRQH